ncbi:N-lysine methyltransferase setd6 isoform X2 [Durio zibethinus]|uniref:N-lysine methyltransferase n=1 Tax=Durio zibethinus TaxID=66656 RepID=A0A6P5YM93_DURZI|nr:N-lysine methyltransferase setd6 isoform X2 [Durio zibethinus]
MASRRLRAFKRWMKSEGIECSDTLEFTDCPEQEISVRALCDLKEGDVVAKIPKAACLTIKTSGAREMIESAGLDGPLGLSVALMYEKSLGQDSPWAGYLQLLRRQECLPLVWTLRELDSLLCGTELHKTVKEDKALIYEDWKESILPLVYLAPQTFSPCAFSVEEYFAARSLIASRSFQIDEYHGFGMVPLADLFNHKTGAEDVHFTSVCSNQEYDNDADSDNSDNNKLSKISVQDKKALGAASNGENSYIHSDSEYSSSFGDDPMMLQMIMVREVKSGVEVFNTYGSLGNAALLHRYGFTEPNNPFDIVNIDLELVLKWGFSLFSNRYCRAKLSLWRRLDFSGCVSENSEYFEISSDGEPQRELLTLLYIMLLPEDACHKLDINICTADKVGECIGMMLSEKHNIKWDGSSEISKELLLTEKVCNALLALADIRESCYGSKTIDEDMEALKRCCMKERKLYHSLVLRISERKILEKLRTFATIGAQTFQTAKKTFTRKIFKRRKVT